MEDSYASRKRKAGGLCSVRYILCGMLFLGCFLVYAMRINLSVSIVVMVNSSTTDPTVLSNDSCPSDDVPTNHSTPDDHQGEFNWNEAQQATVTYAFFVGYLLSQIPGGYLSEIFSVTWVLGLGIGLTSVLTCLTSVVARFNFYAFIVLRVLEGIGEGVTFPSIFAFVARWVAVEEQSFLMNMIVAGCSVGIVVTMPLSAILCKSVLGWPASFYIFGFLGIIWTIVWFIVAADGPEHHRFISNDEKEYILNNRPKTAGKKLASIPWKRILLSPPILLLGVNRLAETMNFYMIITELPNFLKTVYGINIIDNGFINGVINMGFSISMVLSGALADKLIVRGIFQRKLSRNVTRKVLTALSTMVPSACLCLLPVVGCNYGVVLGLLMVNSFFLGVSGGGDQMVPLDLAPKYAGTVQGVVNMMGNVAGILAPELVGFMTLNDNTRKQWNLVFIYTAIFTTVGSSIFLFFGSTEEQEWAANDADQEDIVDDHHSNNNEIEN